MNVSSQPGLEPSPDGQPPAPAPAAAQPRLLGRDYWLVLSSPSPATTSAGIQTLVEEHVAWLLKLEAEGTVFLSGPLVSGPSTGPGSGVTVLRAASADHAAAIAATDPFVVHGLRTFQVFAWRVNEGAISIQLSLGSGGYTWT